MNMLPFSRDSEVVEEDLRALPEESDVIEYKGSAIDDQKLATELSVAASAFWNSGGGILIAGINRKTREIDGGITRLVGRTSRRDWVDQQLQKTQPPGPYWIKIIPEDEPEDSSVSQILSGNIVLIVGFEDSVTYPHMAHDYKHYIRSGAHSNPANQFILEALRSRRVVQSPLLRALLRRSEQNSRVIELVIAVVNDASAMNVQVTFDPMPISVGLQKEVFPLKIPLIDRLNPFVMDLYIWGGRSQTFGDDAVNLVVKYEDMLGRLLTYTQVIEPSGNVNPVTMGDTDLHEIYKSINAVTKSIHQLRQAIEDGLKPDESDETS